MSCGCNYEYEDGAEPAEVWNEGRTAKTRKDHRCCECGAVIPAGSRCCWARWVSDGEARTLRRCLDCAALAEAISTVHKVCPLWGGLHDYCSYGDEGLALWRRFHPQEPAEEAEE